MASTRDYLEYLNQKIDIAPVNSEEEYQAAELIESLMQAHGLETRVQDFSAPGLGALPYRVCGIILFVAVVLSGFLGTRAALVGELLAVVCLVLLGVRHMGYADPLGKLGRPLNSQNVIGIHRGVGPLVAKGTRPVVIVAHYDTPRENLLSMPPFDRFQAMIRRFSPQCVAIAAVLTLVQLFGFMPAGVRHLLWVVAVVAALPQLLLGIAAVQERFSPCTEGSNDNKSGVAAMLGVLAKVHPGSDEADGYGEQRVQRDREYAARREAELAALEAAARAADEEARLAEEAAVEAGQSESDLGVADGSVPEEGADALADGQAMDVAADDGELLEEDVAGESANPYDEGPVGEDAVMPYEEGYVAPAAPAEPQTVVHHELRVERVEGVRHGQETLERLGILPAGCEIVYVEPRSQEVTWEETLPQAEWQAGESAGYDEYADSPLPEDYDGYETYEDGGVAGAVRGVLGRIGDFFSAARQSVAERVAEFRARREEAALADEQAAASEALDGIIEEGPQDAVFYEGVDYSEEADLMAEPTSSLEPLDDVLSDGDFASADEGAEVIDFASEAEVLMDEVHAKVDGEEASEEDPIPFMRLVPDSPADTVEGPADGTLPFVPLGQLMDGREVDVQGDSKDATGLDTLATDGTTIAAGGSDTRPAPAPVDDPDWGKSDFRPREVSDVARRAVLFDLPDPLGTTGANDPLRGSLDDTGRVPAGQAGETVAMPTQRGADAAPEDDMSSYAVPQDPAPVVAGGLRGLFSRKKREEAPESMGSWLGVGDDFDAKSDGRAIGSWENFNNADPRRSDDDWKGGAARRSDLRIVGDDDVRVQEELREAVLSMGDDELIAHDIWFVALGGSHAEQAGMWAFLEENRKDIRGCFLINLSCVGSGELSLLTEEGLSRTRRADRRIVRTLQKVAEDLHVGLTPTRHGWEETDATPAMRRSVRSATICGLTPDGALALSKVSNDEPDLVDPAQTTAVTDLVAELIRRA